MRKPYQIIIAAMLVSSCSNTPATNTIASKDSGATKVVAKTDDTSIGGVKDYLLASAAGDFKKGTQVPTAFREIKMGHIVNADGGKIYFICGQCQLENKWTPFATVKTSGYEQYLGKQALTFCNDSSVVWEQGGDLSSALQDRVAAH